MNYTCIDVFDLCGKLILEGFCCIYQPCEKLVTHFAVLSHSYAPVPDPQPLPFLCDVMDRMGENVPKWPQLQQAITLCQQLQNYAQPVNVS